MSLIEGGMGCRYVTLAGVQLAAAWIMCENPWALESSPELYGSNRRTAHGTTRAKQKRSDTTRRSLQLVISGARDRVGAIPADPESQLDNNLTFFRAHCVLPADKGGLNLAADGTRLLTLRTCDGVDHNTAAHTGPFVIGQTLAHVYIATLTVEFPQGGIV